ncbi:hypothetical protein [Cereibacter azotoformans]|uniref:Uncharacterized protein n=1 Tax=Cereibacter azotoformans TaxID=43057 RepID=A0A2T5JSX3_9RHOB|nr:hypothetical protein [Cereibacter azotoformans]MBO4168913.1 hypothetical protein [Cereibacter azotoformans]PTR11188.1 hypothetical protein C8J28_12849 [Cereibacter azotoformans]
MIKPIQLILFAGVLASCTRMDQYYPDAQKTTISGEEFVVRKLSASTYQALPNDPSRYSLTSLDASVWGRNMLAIEKATGCKVMPGSIKNSHMNTIAAVLC